MTQIKLCSVYDQLFLLTETAEAIGHNVTTHRSTHPVREGDYSIC